MSSAKHWLVMALVILVVMAIANRVTVIKNLVNPPTA